MTPANEFMNSVYRCLFAMLDAIDFLKGFYFLYTPQTVSALANQPLTVCTCHPPQAVCICQLITGGLYLPSHHILPSLPNSPQNICYCQTSADYLSILSNQLQNLYTCQASIDVILTMPKYVSNLPYLYSYQICSPI